MATEVTDAVVRDALDEYRSMRSDRARLIERLASLEWPPLPRTLGQHDDLLPTHPWDLVTAALADHTIDAAIYEQIADKLESRARQRHPLGG